MKRFTVTASVIALFGAAALFAHVEAQTRTVYFNAVDKKGAPVADLNAAEIVVKEDGRTQAPFKMERATAPMRIAVVIDDHGLTTFAEAVRGQAEVGVFSTTLPEEIVVDFTRDEQALAAGIQKLVRLAPRMLAGAGLGLDDLTFDLARQFEKQGTARPVMIVVTIDHGCNTGASLGDAPVHGPTGNDIFYSADGSAQSWPTLVVAQLQRSRTAFFGLAARHTSPNDHDPIIDASAEATGGRVEAVLTDSAIPTALKRITDDLLNQYVVTYSASSTQKDGARLRLQVNRPGVVARAPGRVGVR